MSEEESKRERNPSDFLTNAAKALKNMNPLLRIPAQPKAPFLREIL